MKNDNLQKKLDEYLVDDGLDRDICVFAQSMGIEVLTTQTKKEFLALTSINENSKQIILNKSRLNDESLLRFVLAYQLAELIKINRERSVFKIECMENEIYQLAKAIFDRSNKYKNGKLFARKKRYFGR